MLLYQIRTSTNYGAKTCQGSSEYEVAIASISAQCSGKREFQTCFVMFILGLFSKLITDRWSATLT